MKEDKNIDELFREKLQNHEQEPPAYILENVLAGVAGTRRKRRLVLWRVAGVAAALLLAFVAGWQVNYMNRETTKQPIVVNRNSFPETKEAIRVIPENKITPENSQKIQVAVTKPSNKTELNKKLLAVNPDSRKEKIASDEKITNARIDRPGSLHPLKTRIRLINNNEQFANALHEMKVDIPTGQKKEQSIDQQIVEQNQLLLLAQNEIQKKGRWLVGAQVSPAYSVNRGNHSSQYASNMLNSSIGSPVDLGGGVSVEYKPGKRWSVQSGVYYAGLGQTSGNTSNSNKDGVYAVAPGNGYFNTPVNIVANTNTMTMNSNAGVIELKSIPSGIVIGNSLEDKTMASAVVVSSATFIQNFQYIEIPLYLRYNVLDSRFDIDLLGGLSSNVLVGNDTYMEGSSGKTLVGKTQDMQAMNYSGTLGLGLKYGLSKRIFLNVEPRIKYYLNSLNSNVDVSYKPYTIGVFTGISYQF